MSERTGAGATWSSENAREGRRLAADRIVLWLREATAPPARVAVSGPRAEALGARLCGEGWAAEVLDVPPRPLTDAAAERWLGRLVAAPDGPVAALILLEVLEGLDDAERRVLLRALPVSRCYLVFRCPLEGLSRLWDLVAGARGAISPVSLLRWLHANTLLRQRRRHVVQVRDWAAHVAELWREPDFEHPRATTPPGTGRRA